LLLAQLQGELRQLQIQIDEADALIAKRASEHEPCRRLMAIPGVWTADGDGGRSFDRQRQRVS
jgi:transposase